MPSASHVVVEGVKRQVTVGLSPIPDVANPPVPVNVVNATEAPGITDFD